MKIKQKKITVCLASLLFISTAAFSAEEHHEHREHGAHVHGVALLNIAIDGQQLAIELESPAINIVGFEHKASSEKDKQAVITVTKQLKDGSALFVTPKQAQCQLSDSDVESVLIEHHEDHEDHDKHEGHEGHSDGHSEFHANYAFQCKNVAALKNVNLQLLHTYSGIHKLRVQMITAHGQTATEMTADNTLLSFK